MEFGLPSSLRPPSSSSSTAAAVEMTQGNSRQKMRRPRCPQCGSRRYRRDPSTSLVVCALGHVLQGFREEQADDGEEFNASQMTQRRRRRMHRDLSNRPVGKHRRSKAATGVWFGARSRFLFFQCLQLLLRLQLQAVRRELDGVPDEIEAVCRDLWAFYVSLQDDLQPQPYLEARSNKVSDGVLSDATGDKRSVRDMRSASLQRASQAERQALMEEERSESERMDDELRSMGLSGAEDEGETSAWTGSESEMDTNTEVEDYASDDGDRTSMPNRPKSGSAAFARSRHRHQRRARVSTRRAENPLTALLSIIYLGLVTLRVPIFWRDLRALVKSEKLPFLHAVYRLPAEMIRPLHYRQIIQLEGKRVPSLTKLHCSTAKMAQDLHVTFGIEFPEVNALPLLARCNESLLLPPTVYRAAKRLLLYVDVPLYPVGEEASAHLQRDRPQQRPHSARTIRLPALDRRLATTLDAVSVAREVVLLAAVVMVVKMRYGLDGEQRFESAEETDVWAGMPPLPSWLQSLKNNEQRTQRRMVDMADPQSMDVLDMDDEQLNAYLDYAETHLIIEDHPNAFYWRKRDDIDDLLSCDPGVAIAPHAGNSQSEKEEAHRPWHLARLDRQAALTKLYASGSQLVPDGAELHASQLRPGEAHSIYRRVPHQQSDDGKLTYRTSRQSSSPANADLVHPTYARVLLHASRLVDCEPVALADTVYALEIRLIKMILFRRAERESLRRAERRKREASPVANAAPVQSSNDPN